MSQLAQKQQHEREDWQRRGAGGIVSAIDPAAGVITVSVTPTLSIAVKTGKDTGFGHFPSRVFAINAAWLELALTGIDLLAWTQILLLNGELATAEPKKLRYRLLHVAGRITRTARRTRLAIAGKRDKRAGGCQLAHPGSVGLQQIEPACGIDLYINGPAQHGLRGGQVVGVTRQVCTG